MKGRVDKSMGIVTLIAEALAKIKTEVLRRILKRREKNESDILKTIIFKMSDSLKKKILGCGHQAFLHR